VAQAAGEENFFLFGLTAEQVEASRGWHNPRWHYEHEPETWRYILARMRWISATNRPGVTVQTEMVAGRALRAGLVVTPPESPVLPGASISGIRLCLGTASSIEQLKVGLERLKGALASKPSDWDSLV